ncbi:MAG: hypothetical protein HYR64_10755 [Fimbriimonas ginsengisoli]|uniref:Uncharacterized protein n=1 Tax=Fimbriimonas ginsengisoli TaxID=1005039 RepID=A0A931M242_FIMGI|nr:hypothetical protein [Fimbriimonas ginsengisoli]
MRIRRLVMTVLGGLLVVALAHAQEGLPIRVRLENAYMAGAGDRGAQHRYSWGRLESDLGPAATLVVSGNLEPGESYLDENYLQFTHRGVLLKAGKHRSAFGFNDWAEIHYTGLIRAPMVRDNEIFGETALDRVDGGLQASFGGPTLQATVGAVDIDVYENQLMPKRLDHGVARLQTQQGSLILGLSGLARIRDADPDHSRALGLDLRWTAPNTIVRAEAIRAFGDDAPMQGYYADLFYRPKGSTGTRLVGRIEGFGPSGQAINSSLATFGVRQVLTPSFTLSLNYAVGSRTDPASGMRGWTGQLMSSVNF